MIHELKDRLEIVVELMKITTLNSAEYKALSSEEDDLISMLVDLEDTTH